jgi:4-amino-4-deoxy-L-arabinose transferase-like glycosyltransferase
VAVTHRCIAPEEIGLSGKVLSLQIRRNSTSTSTASWKLALALGLMSILSRWPLHSRRLYDEEAAGMAFVALRLPLPNGAMPAPSGALYIELGRQLINLLGSPETAFVVLSVAASGLAVAALYFLGAALFNQITGIIAAALLMSSPLFWFYGAVGLPYACDALIALVAVWLCWQLARGHGRRVLPLALWLALATSLLPPTALALLPLALYAAERAVRVAGLSRLQLVGVVLAGIALGLIWQLPIGAASGTALALQPGPMISLSGARLGTNLGMIVRASAWGWGLAAMPVLGMLPLWALDLPGLRARGGRWGWLHDERVWLCLVWAAPLLLLSLLGRTGTSGQIVASLPILLLWSAAALERLIATGARRLAITAITLIILGNAMLFLATPADPVLGGYRLPSAARIVYQDHRLAGAIVAIRSFSASKTIILSNNWLPVRYYLPAYPLIPYPIAPETTAIGLAQLPPDQQAAIQQATALVWFEGVLDSYNSAPLETDHQPMAVGALRILRPTPITAVFVDTHQFGLRTTPR